MLGGAPAMRGKTSSRRRSEVVVVRQDGRDVDAINYIADLNTSRASLRADEQVMNQTLASFRVFPR